jgi:uncharacterized protein YdaU (DUF1376 family)
MKPKDAPAFDFYPERWTHGTRHMSKVERCDYIDLLCHQWTDDGLPESLEILARLLGYVNAKGAGVPSKIPVAVLEKFPVTEDGKRRNPRLEDERSKQRERIAKKSLGASKTNAKRWGERVADESLSDQLATPKRVANESPPPTTHHITNPHSPQASEREDGLWPDPREYPSLETVKAWAVAVMAPPECAEKWHAERTAEGWTASNGRKPLRCEESALRPLFGFYATAWKTNAATPRRNGYARPAADSFDIKPSWES